MRFRPLLGVLAVAATAGLSAQSQPTFRTGAHYIRVDMYPTRDGRPVDDLVKAEVEVLEDGVRQEIVAFERIQVRAPGPQDARVEPGSVRESREMAADPRARLFVIFLDTYHTQFDGSAKMRVPLANFLDRAIGQDDLVAVMTPEMSAADLTFSRKTALISSMLQATWNWGRRESIQLDPKEEQYQSCYPDVADKRSANIAQEMIQRRRERLSLDALEDLVAHLAGVREERKAVLTVTEGWVLYSPNSALTLETEQGRSSVPPPFGRRGTQPQDREATLRYDCEADRAMLAQIDHRLRLVQLAEQANRGNVTFYPVYPRGLQPTDAPVGPARPPSPNQDLQNLATRQDNLRLLADNTDGMSVINTNNIDAGIRRIVDDLSSYYLLGYNSTNAKLDGRFRAISVRVSRPGVRVRARRGYRGPTAAELTRAADPGSRTDAAPIAAAAAGLTSRRSSGVYVRASVWVPPGQTDMPHAVWLVGELDAGLRRVPSWSAGATADVSMISAAGDAVARATVDVSGNDKTFAVRLPETGTLAAGDYAVRLQLRPKERSEPPVGDVSRVVIPDRSAVIGEAVAMRRGPDTGPRFIPIADLRVHRTDRLRVEHPTMAAGAPAARMLDRLGRAMQVPVTTSVRADSASAFKWIVAEAVLAPLAVGDYAIEVSVDGATSVTVFSVVP